MVCRKKKAASKSEPKKKQAHHVDYECSDNDEVEYNVYQVSSGTPQPVMVGVRVNGVNVDIELDT